MVSASGAALGATAHAEQAGDPHRPGYHFMPPANWMNEPHGALQHKGLHHIFYQRNPRAPHWDRIHWGHAVSADLVNWTHLPDALTPDTVPAAPDGIWSGSATVDHDGVPVLFFTAGDNRRDPNQSVVLARSTVADDGDLTLRTWIPASSPAVEMDAAQCGDHGPLLGSEFRDPFAWKDGDEWFMLVGAGVDGAGGTAVLYTSTDLEQWECVGPLMVGDHAARPDTGVMWELPNLLPIGTGADGRPRHVFIVSPWWPEPTEHSLLYAWYWIGVWDARARTFVPDHAEPRMWDYGGHLTGPTGLVDEQGRALVWSVAQDRRDDAEHDAAGWAHNAGLPVQLWLGDDGDLRVAPVPELSALRREPMVDAAGLSPGAASSALASCAGDMLELRIDARLPASSSLVIHVRRVPDGTEATVIRCEASAEPGQAWLAIDRARCHGRGGAAPAGDVRGGPLPLESGDRLRLRVFVDRSMVEAYANDRRSLTTRSYPLRPDALGVGLEATGDVRIDRLTVWPLSPSRMETAPV